MFVEIQSAKVVQDAQSVALRMLDRFKFAGRFLRIIALAGRLQTDDLSHGQEQRQRNLPSPCSPNGHLFFAATAISCQITTGWFRLSASPAALLRLPRRQT